MLRSNKQNISLILLLCNVFIAFLGIGLVVPVLPAYMNELNLSGVYMGYLIAAFSTAQLFSSPVTGIFTDRFGRKIMIVIGLVLFAVSEFLFAIGSAFFLLLISRIIGGISAACIMPAVTAFITDITTLEDRPKALGYLSASINAGFIIGPGIGGFAAEFGIRVPFFLAAFIALVAAVFSILLLKEPLPNDNIQQLDEKQTRLQFFSELSKSIKPPYVVPLLIVFVLAFGLSAYETMFGLFVDKKFGFSLKDISIVITTGTIFGLIAQIVFFDKLVKYLGEKRLIEICLLGASVFIFLSTLVDGYFFIMAVTFAVFLACDLLRPAVTTLLSNMAGDEQGFIAGMNSTYTSLGNIVGPAIAGILFDIDVDFPYVLASIVLLLAFMMAALWPFRDNMEQKRKNS